jgi:uncharacterized surface protein with fasciclin (FAS1) repeats
MNIKTVLAGGSAVALAAGMAVGTAPAQAAGTTPLAEVLTQGKISSADQVKFDKKGKDFDILTKAVLAVLENNSKSQVAALTKGNVRLTAFIPNDKAFRGLASTLKGSKVTSEEDAFNTVADLGLDTVEAVLLYHVVPGKPILSKKAVKANGAQLKTAQGDSLTVKVNGKKGKITLVDGATKLKNAKVVKPVDVNKGNRQVAHAISAVMLPMNPM